MAIRAFERAGRLDFSPLVFSFEGFVESVVSEGSLGRGVGEGEELDSVESAIDDVMFSGECAGIVIESNSEVGDIVSCTLGGGGGGGGGGALSHARSIDLELFVCDTLHLLFPPFV